MSGEAAAGVVGHPAAAAEVQGLDVGAVAGEGGEGGVPHRLAPVQTQTAEEAATPAQDAAPHLSTADRPLGQVLHHRPGHVHLL